MARKPIKKALKETVAEVVEIQEIRTGIVQFCILGTSPLIMHRYPKKAWQELIFPSVSQNRAGLESTLKHVPIEEYREACYVNRDSVNGKRGKSPTLFHLPNGMFAACLAQAGVDVPGAARAELERLTRVTDLSIDLYGVPEIFCAMVRNSGMNRTPDVRTRPIFPEWACSLTVRYVMPRLTERTINNLMGAAGLIVGVGDWRGQKGGPYGAFKPVGENDKDFRRIVKTQGRKVQELAFEKPAYFDSDTEDLLRWFDQELIRRERDGTADRRRREPKLPTNGKVIDVRGYHADETFLGVSKL